MGVPGVGEGHLAGGRYAIAAHVGPYSGLGPAWGRFMAAIEALGLEVDDQRPCFEVYENDPDHVDESRLVTVLHQPVR
jgi:AraC family transcriptional regulator